MKIFKYFPFLALTAVLMLPKIAIGNDEPKLILIHLDSVSSHYVQQEMEKGNLPNLMAFFGEKGRIDHTITYFPSKTPTVISSLRFGDSLREAPLPGWGWVADRVEGPFVTTVGTFLRMVFSTSRLSTTNILYGIRWFNWLSGPALINTADYLKDYNILEFYWYNVDAQGHFSGEEAYIKELVKFDRQFGRLIKRLDDDVNVIVYSDHGMTFGEAINIDIEVAVLAGDDMNLYSYPSLYLKDPEKSEYYAKLILEETDLDFTFFSSSETQVKGFHRDGIIIFNKNYEDVTINYEYKGEDILGYHNEGYNGEFLNLKEWLELTHDLEYPLAPVNLFHHMDHSSAGHVITLFERSKYSQTPYARSGNHGGFTYQDMTVPLFIKGPQVEKLYSKEYYWLPDLFNDIEDIDFNQHPPRERHKFATRYDFRNRNTVTDISASPIYRIKYGVSMYNSEFDNLSSFDRVDIFGMGDLFRSYLSRFWIGTGVEIKNSEVNPLLILQYDIHLRKFVFHNSYATNRSFYFRASYEATPWLAIETVNFTSLGIRLDF